MTARIYRYQVPVDDRVHVIDLNGSPCHVGCRDPQVLEFWAIHRDGVPTVGRHFTVVGTGHRLPTDQYRHWGTAVAPGGALVWHLVEVNLPDIPPALALEMGRVAGELTQLYLRPALEAAGIDPAAYRVTFDTTPLSGGGP